MLSFQPGIHTAPLGINDLFFGLLLLIAILMYSQSIKRKKMEQGGNEHYRYYMLNIYFKLFFALAYGAIYMFYYQGGDTMAYWQGAEKLNNLMWHAPLDYWEEMMSQPIEENIILRFTPETGSPPIWIYQDPGSFFVSKVFSIFMIFFGQSYVALSLVFGYISAIASWKVFELVKRYNITSDGYAAIAMLFIPSVAFWCSSVSKDAVVLISVFMLLHHLFGIANKTAKSTTRSVFWIIVYCMILYSSRTFMLFTVLAPVFLALNIRITKKYRKSILLINLIRFFIIGATFISFLFFLRSQGEAFSKTTNQYLEEAALQQSDFANNETYGDKRYDLEITDYTPLGMLRKAPIAILTAIYRPGLWEARSALLFISGLETAVFIYLTLLFFFKGNLAQKIQFIRFNEFLVFSFMFAIILAFFAGFTSGLFGVLVRFKAPLLPFFLILLTTNPKLSGAKMNDEDELDENPQVEKPIIPLSFTSIEST